MEHAPRSRGFPTDPKEYKLYEEVGEGVSATVYRALCVPLNILVAIKVLDLEKCSNDLDGIRREVQTMSLIDHPNLLRACCSFANDHQLWVVMPFMAAGSALHIMKTNFPDGFEEPVIATLLREVLKALIYLHSQGHIHRDVKPCADLFVRAGSDRMTLPQFLLLSSDGDASIVLSAPLRLATQDFCSEREKMHLCLGLLGEQYDEGSVETDEGTTILLLNIEESGSPTSVIKAGNILIDTNGAVKLGDFGVSACMFDTGNRQRARNTFVGTPCWMAPEVMQQLHGYDYKADIWSFGITALELAHGHAPFSKYPPMKVLLMTLQNAPPGLDYERDKRFSKSFKDLVATCLVKDPQKRPSSEKLLKHSFFKQARSAEFVARSILEGLPPLGERFRALKAKEADLLLNNKLGPESKEQLSQKEYIRGISGWNFNLDDLKNAAALLDSSNGTYHLEDSSKKVKDGLQDAYNEPENIYHERVNHGASAGHDEDEIQEVEDLDGALASSFPARPLDALKSCFDVCGNDGLDPTATNLWVQPSMESISPVQQVPESEHNISANCNGENLERSVSVPSNLGNTGYHKFSSGSLIPEHVLSPYKNVGNDSQRNEFQHKNPSNRNRSGPLLFRQMKDSRPHFSGAPDEPSEGNVVQRRGRFQVTSDKTAQKVASASSSSRTNLPSGVTRQTPNSSTILPTLQFLMQQNTMQKEVLSRLISSIEETSDASDASIVGSSQSSGALVREKEMESYVVNLQRSVTELAEEVQRLKLRNNQLEQQINALSKKDERLRREDK